MKEAAHNDLALGTVEPRRKREWKTGYGDASACLKLRIPLSPARPAGDDIKLRASFEADKTVEFLRKR
jgi:hypothetical protein